MELIQLLEYAGAGGGLLSLGAIIVLVFKFRAILDSLIETAVAAAIKPLEESVAAMAEANLEARIKDAEQKGRDALFEERLKTLTTRVDKLEDA